MKSGTCKNAVSKLMICLGVAVLAVCFSSPVFAAPWTAPANVRIVQKSNTDNQRVFGTIMAALNSITDASPTNRYVIKVMPGVYSEAVTMKPYVDIAGAGQNNTTISSATTGNGFVADDQTAVENLTITTSVLNNSSGNLILIKANTSTIFRNVTVMLPANANYHEIIYADTSSKFQLINSTILSDGNVENVGMAIEARGSSLDMAHSTIAITTIQPNGSMAIWNTSGDINISYSKITITGPSNSCGVGNGSQAIGTIFSSVISISSATTGMTTEGVLGKNWDIQNSQILATSSDQINAWGVTASDVKITNSIVSGSTLGVHKMQAGKIFKIGNSQIVGGHDGIAGTDKVVNCIDGNYDHIPDL